MGNIKSKGCKEMDICKRLAKKRNGQLNRILKSTYDDFDVVL